MDALTRAALQTLIKELAQQLAADVTMGATGIDVIRNCLADAPGTAPSFVSTST
jgi:hypothetical protein